MCVRLRLQGTSGAQVTKEKVELVQEDHTHLHTLGKMAMCI